VHDLCDELGLRCQVDITAGAARAWTNVDERFPLGRSNSVAAVAGVVGAFVGRKETECGRDEVAHLLEGAGTHRAQERF
jgi:hypothetical protein